MKLLSLAITAALLAPSFDATRLLASIAQKEGHQSSDLGGRYAIGRAAWSDATKLPYRLSALPEYAEPVAREHLRRLERGLTARGVEPSPYNLASAWHLGLEGFLHHKGICEYGLHVANLYYSTHSSNALQIR